MKSTEAEKTLKAARHALAAAIREDFPEGSHVSWRYGERRRFGVVVSHADGWSSASEGYVFAKNPRTGAVHGVHFGRLSQPAQRQEPETPENS